MEDNFEIRILGEYQRRSKKLKTIQKKAAHLKDMDMKKESKEFQELFELQLNELEAYYRKFRTTLVKYGVLPVAPLFIDDITEKERTTATDWLYSHRKKYGI